MTVPPVPANLATGNVVGESWVDDVRALLAYMRDTAPSIHGESGNLSTTSGTSLTVDMSAAAYSAEVGTWVKGTTTSTRLDVPDPGLYLVSYGLRLWPMGTPAGRMEVALTAYLNSGTTTVSIPQRWCTADYHTGYTHAGVSTLVQIDAGGGLEFVVSQDSAIGQNDTIVFDAVWLSA